MTREDYVLGIDAGGTHTDAVICAQGKVIARAKGITNHADLPQSIEGVLTTLIEQVGLKTVQQVQRITLGTTLAVNAIVQEQLAPVALLLTAGPGLSPLHFTLGEHYSVIPGGLDHRGVEVTPLDRSLARVLIKNFLKEGINAFACVGKFSPRNPVHEQRIAQEIRDLDRSACISLGHHLSGELNFPRRIATAYYNAAVSALHNAFLDAICRVFTHYGLTSPIFLLKADGGSVPIALSRTMPVQSILSGPAASVMGLMALEELQGTSLLLDMGGTTTDLALFVDDAPVMSRDGMVLKGRRTLVRALATRSIGVGGDSLLSLQDNGVQVGPLRLGPAMAFGGTQPTLLDAMNVLATSALEQAGDTQRSLAGITALATSQAWTPTHLAQQAWENAVAQIKTAIQSLVEYVNASPIYTLRGLREYTALSPEHVYFVGGPSKVLATRLAQGLHLPVTTTNDFDVVNAIGAALTRPTASLEVYADTASKQLLAPALDKREELPRTATLDFVTNRCQSLLAEHMHNQGLDCPAIETTEASLFAILSDYGHSSKHMRVSCQVQPGLVQRVQG